MKTRIDIDYSTKQIAENAKRMRSCAPGKKYCGRVPVTFCVVPRFFTPLFGIEYNEIFKDAKTQLHWLLQFAKYTCEHIDSEMQTSTTLYVHPYFDNVITSSGFGAEVVFPYNETCHALPVLNNPSDVRKLQLPSPEVGIVGRTIRWWFEMKELIKDVEVYWQGEQGAIEMAPLGLICLGPHNVATDLVGEEIYWWMKEEPELYHELLCKVTQGLIVLEDFSRQVDPRKKNYGVGIAEDTAQVISREDFIKNVAPYDLMYYGRYGDVLNGTRGMHMCGDSTYLLDILADVLKITHFSLFGYMVDLNRISETMGGKVNITGNINPMKMLQGSPAEIKEDCFKVMRALAPYGGFTLGDGANVCPGTPLGNVNSLAEASREFAAAHPEILDAGLEAQS